MVGWHQGCSWQPPAVPVSRACLPLPPAAPALTLLLALPLSIRIVAGRWWQPGPGFGMGGSSATLHAPWQCREERSSQRDPTASRDSLPVTCHGKTGTARGKPGERG